MSSIYSACVFQIILIHQKIAKKLKVKLVSFYFLFHHPHMHVFWATPHTRDKYSIIKICKYMAYYKLFTCKTSFLPIPFPSFLFPCYYALNVKERKYRKSLHYVSPDIHSSSLLSSSSSTYTQGRNEKNSQNIIIRSIYATSKYVWGKRAS